MDLTEAEILFIRRHSSAQMMIFGDRMKLGTNRIDVLVSGDGRLNLSFRAMEDVQFRQHMRRFTEHFAVLFFEGSPNASGWRPTLVVWVERESYVDHVHTVRVLRVDAYFEQRRSGYPETRTSRSSSSFNHELRLRPDAAPFTFKIRSLPIRDYERTFIMNLRRGWIGIFNKGILVGYPQMSVLSIDENDHIAVEIETAPWIDLSGIDPSGSDTHASFMMRDPLGEFGARPGDIGILGMITSVNGDRPTMHPYLIVTRGIDPRDHRADPPYRRRIAKGLGPFFGWAPEVPAEEIET